MIFAEWAETWLEVYKKPFVSNNTFYLTYEINIRKHLNPYFGKMEISEIKQFQIQQFFSSNTDFSLSILKKFHMILTNMFDTAISNDLCVKNPCNNIRYASINKKNPKRVLNSEEIKIVENAAFHTFPEITFILETGLRRGEVCGLMWQDIKLDNQSFLVDRSIAVQRGGGVTIMPPKWGSYRELPLSPLAENLIRKIPQTSEYVFPNLKGNVQIPTILTRRCTSFMTNLHHKYGVPSLTPHELRHTYGTNLRRYGIDIYTIQKLLGHKDINVTSEIYVHNEFEVLRRQMTFFYEKQSLSQNPF